MRPVVIIVPDAERSASLRVTLEAAGFRTAWFATAAAALPQLRASEFSLVLLDLDLRDGDPFAVCREISPLVPVIAVSGVCAAETCVRALELGADDCVERRTSGRELVARIRGVLRRSSIVDENALHSLAGSISEMRVRASDGTHNLTRGETELLSLLLEYAPAPLTVTRLSELLQTRRGTIESRVKSLRRKLGAERLLSRGSLGYQLAEALE